MIIPGATPRPFFRAALLILIMLLLAVPEAPSARAALSLADTPLANIITQVILTPTSPNLLTHSQDVSLTFNYTTDSADGARIFARPMTGGALTPGYSASGSPIYPTGSGAGSGSFTITSGEVVVDQIRFQIYDANQTVLLQELFIPVHLQFTAAASRVTGISLSPVTPNLLTHNQDVSLIFNYTTDSADGARIFARPMTGGALTPGYSASGSPIYPTGSGAGSGSFTITSGEVVVDQIRFQIYDANQTVLLQELFIPVHFQFTAASDVVRQFSYSPPTANILAFNNDVTLNFQYSTNHVGGVRIFARPFTQGALSPDYAASGSPVFPVGSGPVSAEFTIVSTNTTVDQIRIQVYNVDQSVLLQEFFLPVHFQFNQASAAPGIINTTIYLPSVAR